MNIQDDKLAKIVENSNNLMGLTDIDLSKLLGKTISSKELKLSKLSIESYMNIAQFYLLCEFDLFASYNEELHIRRICKSILDGSYPHKKSSTIKKHLKQFKKNRYRDEYKYYGPRLRLQLRINRILNTNIKIPSPEDILPYWIRYIIYKTNKMIKLKRHILKHGSYENFCCYDIRYDSREQCRGDYYKILFNSNNNKRIVLDLI